MTTRLSMHVLTPLPHHRSTLVVSSSQNYIRTKKEAHTGTFILQISMYDVSPLQNMGQFHIYSRRKQENASVIWKETFLIVGQNITAISRTSL